ncbi:MAG: hypothetical protein WC097_01565 [Eubacteriales bacterium]
MIKPAQAEDIKTEQAIFNKAWALLKKYYFIAPETETEEDWEAVVAGASDIYNTGKDTIAEDLGKAIALATIDHIEKLYKERKVG